MNEQNTAAPTGVAVDAQVRLIPAGWQYRACEDGEYTAWYYCDDRTADLLHRRTDYEIRQLYALEQPNA